MRERVLRPNIQIHCHESRIVILVLALLALLTSFPVHGRRSNEVGPDLVLMNGRIWTGNEAQPWASAVAISGNKVVAVGETKQIRKLATPKTMVIDLVGKFVMPGINDSHVHFLGGALKLFEVELTGARSLEEIQRRVAKFARENRDER